MNRNTGNRLKATSALAALSGVLLLLSGCGSSSSCVPGSSKNESGVISICASVDGSAKELSDGADYKNLVLLSKLVAFNVEQYPEYVFNETEQNNNDQLNTFSDNFQSLKADDFTYYVAGDSRWDSLVQSFSAYKSAELDWRLAQDVPTRKIYLYEMDDLLTKLRPKIEVLISDLMGKYGITDRQQVKDFAVLLYKEKYPD
jgi:hypothetical protein